MSGSVPVEETVADDFDIKQHDFLRTEIQTAEASARANERYALLALAALWAWAAKEAPQIGVVIGIISASIGLLGGLRTWALWINMATKASYVAHVEHHHAHVELGGWEHYVRDVAANRDTVPGQNLGPEYHRSWVQRPGAIGYTSAAFWLLIMVASVPCGFLLRDFPPAKGGASQAVEVRCVSEPAVTVGTSGN
jgi:hypothetical protein